LIALNWLQGYGGSDVGGAADVEEIAGALDLVVFYSCEQDVKGGAKAEEVVDVPGRYLPALERDVWVSNVWIDFLPSLGEEGNLGASPTWEVCQLGDLHCVSSMAIASTPTTSSRPLAALKRRSFCRG
jgi:hypothetical protein